MSKQFLTQYISVSSSLSLLQGWRRYLGSQDLGQLLIVYVSVRVCVCLCVCFDRPSPWRHKIGSGKSQTKTAPGVGLAVKTLSSRVGCVLLIEDPT